MKKVKLALCTIVFNGMPFLEGLFETFRPHIEQIVVAEGPVKFWHEKTGHERSTDGTVEFLGDYQRKHGSGHCRFTRGVWKDKREMCAGWMELLRDDITHLALFDADELMHSANIEQVKRYLATGKYDSVGLMLRSFVGGFQHYLTGFEQLQDTIRFLRYIPGDSIYATHRPPTIMQISTGKRWPALSLPYRRHLDFHALSRVNIFLYHYSHVLPSQIKAKEQYYAAHFCGTGNLIPNYYRDVWLPWVQASEAGKIRIEDKWAGIHDFHPRYRGECQSEIFVGYHPRWIEEKKKYILWLQQKEIKQYGKEET